MNLDSFEARTAALGRALYDLEHAAGLLDAAGLTAAAHQARRAAAAAKRHRRRLYALAAKEDSER